MISYKIGHMKSHNIILIRPKPLLGLMQHQAHKSTMTNS